MTITLALSKGRIFDETLPLLAAAGIEVLEDPEKSRKLILPTNQPNVRVVLVRATDVPTYVEYGGADIGVTGKERMEILPKLPTIFEQGVTDDAYSIYGWVAMGAPAGIPKEIVDQLSAHLREVAKDPKVVERIAAAGFLPMMNSPQEFQQNYQRDMPIWKALVEAAGARLD